MKLKILLGGVFVIPVILIWFLYPFTVSEKNIRIKCHYMMYACGDCYPQYRVDEVVKGNSESKKMLHSEINVEFIDAKLEKELDDKVAKCITCYDFYFTGQFKRSGKKGIYMLAEKAEARLRDNKCCN